MNDLDEVAKEKILKTAQKMSWSGLSQDQKDKYLNLAEMVWKSLIEAKG